MVKRTAARAAATVIILWFILVIALVAGGFTVYEDQSIQVYDRGFCLGETCGGFGDQELLQSHDLPAGYFIFGSYTPPEDGGEVLCFHDFEVCIFQR